jgi:hypothetical protein
MTRWVNKQDVMLFIHVFNLYMTADSLIPIQHTCIDTMDNRPGYGMHTSITNRRGGLLISEGTRRDVK